MNIEYEKDNKERIPFEHYKAEYLKSDPIEISNRTGFPYSEDKQCFIVSFLGKEYEIGHPEFTVKCTQEDAGWTPVCEMNAAQVLVLRFLLEGNKVASTGKFLTYQEVPWGEVYIRQFTGRCKSRLAFSYGFKIAKFREALEKMGGIAISAGDAGYEIETFPGFFVRFQMWEPDDEFPPSSQILFSDNFTTFHAEDLVVVCDVIITYMKFI